MLDQIRKYFTSCGSRGEGVGLVRFREGVGLIGVRDMGLVGVRDDG